MKLKLVSVVFILTTPHQSVISKYATDVYLFFDNWEMKIKLFSKIFINTSSVQICLNNFFLKPKTVFFIKIRHPVIKFLGLTFGSRFTFSSLILCLYPLRWFPCAFQHWRQWLTESRQSELHHPSCVSDKSHRGRRKGKGWW